LIIACINYVNLATAKAADRAKEVGIRKVAGAIRSQLFFQFISESLIVTLAGIVLAFFIASVALPFFNSLTGKNFFLTDLFNLNFLLLSSAVWLCVAFLAGAYPAIAITSFKPVSVLKGILRIPEKAYGFARRLSFFNLVSRSS